MDFLRKNLFFVILAGGMIAAVAAAWAVGSGPRGDIERELQKRQKVSDDLNRLNRQPAVNEVTLKDKVQWVNDIRDTANRVQQETAQWNRRNYSVLQIELRDGRKISAFPVDLAMYASEPGVKYEFTQKYVTSYGALLRSLQPTTPALEAEIRAEVERARTELLRDTTMDKALAEQEAEQKGKNTLMVGRAREGRIYVAKDAPLGQVFTEPKALAGYDELWYAQLHLWITTDILESIREVNEAAWNALPEKAEHNVLGLPIKRLVAIAMDEKYYYTAPREAETAATKGKAGALLPGASLTTRTCCPMYDAVHYSFTVVMSDAFLPDLKDRLMRRTNHTVLKVEMAPFEAASADKTVYYYGTQPVIAVTVTGEVLLLAAWERGAWQADKKAWSPDYPPLIPVEALRAIAERSPQALRQEDAQRIR